MKIKVHPSFWIYLGSMALLASPAQCLSACAALCVHEGAHWAAASMVGERFRSMEITPFGGVMIYEKGRSPAKGLKGAAVAAAGPLGNYLFVLLLGTVGRSGSQLAGHMITGNAAMLLLNMLPALPLDGGRILFCAGYYLLSVSRLAAILSALGAALGAGFICVGLYGAWSTGALNISMLIVGGYLIAYALSSRATLLSENLYAVVQERLGKRESASTLTLYAVPGDMPLHALITLIDRTHSAAFVFEQDEKLRLVGEKEVLHALLKQSDARISEIARAKADQSL